MLNSAMIRSTETDTQLDLQVSFVFTCKVKGKAVDSAPTALENTTPAPAVNVEANHMDDTAHGVKAFAPSDVEDEVKDSEEDSQSDSSHEDSDSEEGEPSLKHRLVVSAKRLQILQNVICLYDFRMLKRNSVR